MKDQELKQFYMLLEALEHQDRKSILETLKIAKERKQKEEAKKKDKDNQ